jgi:hypothetical protein
MSPEQLYREALLDLAGEEEASGARWLGPETAGVGQLLIQHWVLTDPQCSWLRWRGVKIFF